MPRLLQSLGSSPAQGVGEKNSQKLAGIDGDQFNPVQDSMAKKGLCCWMLNVMTNSPDDRIVDALNAAYGFHSPRPRSLSEIS